MKHTPTPYLIDRCKQKHLHTNCNKVVTVEGDLIAECYGQDNAEFIVKAVNSHEALVEACKTSLDYFEQLFREGHLNTDNQIKHLREALKQAEEL